MAMFTQNLMTEIDENFTKKKTFFLRFESRPSKIVVTKFRMIIILENFKKEHAKCNTMLHITIIYILLTSEKIVIYEIACFHIYQKKIFSNSSRYAIIMNNKCKSTLRGGGWVKWLVSFFFLLFQLVGFFGGDDDYSGQ